MSKSVQITRNYLIVVDDEDLKLCKGKLFKVDERCTNYYINDKSTRSLARLLLKIRSRKVQIKHLDGDRFNFRKNNLKILSFSNNQGASRLSRANTSGFKGVAKFRNKWISNIGNKYIGVYDTPQEGARAYDAKAIEMYGETAMTNVKLGLLPPLERK